MTNEHPVRKFALFLAGSLQMGFPADEAEALSALPTHNFMERSESLRESTCP